MSKRNVILISILAVGAVLFLRAPKIDQSKPTVIEPVSVLPSVNVDLKNLLPTSQTFSLNIPYISESPDGDWSGPWKNACEEASIAMVEFFYQGKTSATIEEAKNFMQRLFDLQDERWGSNANSDAARTVEIINDYTSFSASVKENPTIEDIKNEVSAGRPVITLHYGKDLRNPNIPFLRTGSYYHMMVVTGFDDFAEQFIVNDDGDTRTGENHRYGYDLFMNSIHDYIYSTKKTDGPPRVIFTSQKN